MINKERWWIFKLGEEIVKMEYSTCRERGTKEKSESPTGIKPMTFHASVGRSNHWATGRLVASIGRINWVRGDTRSAYCWDQLQGYRATVLQGYSATGYFDIAAPSSMQDACHHELSKWYICMDMHICIYAWIFAL